ncbi:hypothetical protein E5676_scaffold769G00410 [Cucumis melo var. makuwa]|uniref:Uncharacterized protein n=1 Tax=Cucumis melo var. makuwa TaxID=1194695 RepID=A0A5D3CL11_CUCMM|nr:hypothetical protein E5676_scaffold769G00410 [Cucumis melo var. makuwa]
MAVIDQIPTKFSVPRSPGPKGSSAQLPTPPGIALSEPSQEWPGQKDSVIGTETTYTLVKENHLDRIRVNKNVDKCGTVGRDPSTARPNNRTLVIGIDAGRKLEFDDSCW